MPGGGPALGREAVEQDGPGAAAKLKRELPGQVMGVVHAGVQALAAERARQVPGIAEQEPQLVGQARRRPSVHAESGRPAYVLQSYGWPDAPLDAVTDGVDGGVMSQPPCLIVVQVADESDPAVAGQRGEQHVARGAG